jgi:hypothetical protein
MRFRPRRTQARKARKVQALQGGTVHLRFSFKTIKIARSGIKIMRTKTRIALFASLLCASALVAAAPTSAQDFHRPSTGGPHGGPGFGPSPSPVHGAAPGHVLGSGGPSTGFHGGPPGGTRMIVHPFTFQHHDFAHFTAQERTTWQAGWWHHGWWHGRWGWWWFAGGFWWWYDTPIYPWPTYISETYYVEPTYETGYGNWYYCANPPGYYPYVQYCNGPWQPVPAVPQGGYYGGQGGGPGPQGGYDQGGPPMGPQGGYEQGPPGYDQGPPPNSGQGPQNYGDQGPPPGDEQGPPPGSSQ